MTWCTCGKTVTRCSWRATCPCPGDSSSGPSAASIVTWSPPQVRDDPSSETCVPPGHDGTVAKIYKRYFVQSDCYFVLCPFCNSYTERPKCRTLSSPLCQLIRSEADENLAQSKDSSCLRRLDGTFCHSLAPRLQISQLGTRGTQTRLTLLWGKNQWITRLQLVKLVNPPSLICRGVFLLASQAPVRQTALLLPRHGLRSLLHDRLRVLDVVLAGSQGGESQSK